MTVLDLAQKHVTLRRSGGNKHFGPCPKCGGDSRESTRFVVYPDQDSFHCFCCKWHGDAITFIREMDGLSCPDAHEALGKSCDSTTCAVRDKCRLGDGRIGAVRRDPLRTTPAMKVEQKEDWTPSSATDPAAKWAEKAEKLTGWAHEQLLACSEQLDFLAARGLPIDAIKAFRLGWIPQDLYRERSAWGLPADEISEKTGKPKKLWIPQGILIPFTADGRLHRIRIRRHKIEGDQPRYYWLPGSGNDVVVINPKARAFAVIESDLDGLAVVHSAGDLVGAVPLGTCSAKPKEHADDLLRNALCILVALDFDAPDGHGRRAGSRAWTWWRDHYPRAERWPVPLGKDPGDFVKDHGGDLRAWVEAGLHRFCPALTIQASKPQEKPAEKDPEKVVAPSAQTSATAEIPQALRELADMLAKYPVGIDRREGTAIREKGNWIAKNWDEFRRLSRLVFYNDQVLDFIRRHPAEIIHRNNIWDGLPEQRQLSLTGGNP